jgi:hypothetical protein
MIEPKTLFIEKKVSDSVKVKPGDGTLTLDIPFVPEYIKVKFLDTCHKSIQDTLTWEIAFTGVPELPYQLTITWSITSGRERRFKYTVAKLSSFHNGVNK